MKSFLLGFFILLSASNLALADNVTFEASVNTSRVSLDEVVQLTLTVTGVNDNLDPVSLPVIDGFKAQYLGPSSSTSFVFVNGKSESNSSRSFIYNLFPNKVGKFQIPAITATIANQTYTTQPIDLEVVDASAPQAQASSTTPDQGQSPSLESLKDKILLVVSVDKTDVYVNERVPVTIKLLVNGVPIRDIQYPQFEKNGFLADDFEKPQQSSGLFNGVRYDTVEFKINIYPNHPGEVNLGPAQIQANVLYRAAQNNPDNSIFGADVFNGLFESYATRPISVTAKPLVLHVSALPEENRPNDFSGAIGQFDFQASVSPLQVKVGDPLTLKMDIKGEGNFKNLQMPVIQFPGFKSYEPQIKNGVDEKSAEQVIIPTSSGIKEVPGLHFSYFDTALKDYRTLTQGPFAIQVNEPNPDQEFKAVGFTNLNPAGSTLPGNQFSFRKLFYKACAYIGKLFKSTWFLVSLGIIILLWGAYLLWRRLQDRLRNDPAFRRRHMAVKEARQALVSASGLISTGKTKDFYALLSKTLRDYLANKWHLSSAALGIGEIVSHLKTVQVDDKQIAQLKALLEQADLVCFAGAGRDEAQMKSDLSLTQEMIAYLEKTLK